MSKVGERGILVAAAEMRDAKRVPGADATGVECNGFFESFFSLRKLAKVDVGKALIDDRDGGGGVSAAGILKLAEGFIEKLLVHIRDAEIVLERGGLDICGRFRRLDAAVTE